MDPLVHLECPGLREMLPAHIALERDGIVTVQSLMSPQIGQLLEYPPADVALDRVRIAVVMFVFHQLQAVSESYIAEFTLRFVDCDRMGGQDVFGQEPEGAESRCTEATLTFNADVRGGAQKDVFLEERLDAEAFETIRAGERPFSAVDPAMFNQSNRFLESSVANFTLVWSVLRVGSLVLEQAGRLVEYLATDFANILDLPGVDIFVPPESTQQRIGISTKAAFVALHSIDDNDLRGNSFGFHFRCGHLVGFLLLGMSPLVGLTGHHGYESFAAIDTLDGLFRFLV